MKELLIWETHYILQMLLIHLIFIVLCQLTLIPMVEQWSGQIDMNNNKIINLPEPTSAKDAATKDFVEKSHVSQSGLQKNVFLYQMTDDE